MGCSLTAGFDRVVQLLEGCAVTGDGRCFCSNRIRERSVIAPLDRREAIRMRL